MALVQVLRESAYVIAPADSSWGSKAAAAANGVVCDGTADNLDVLAGLQRGQPVKLLEGNLAWAAPVTYTSAYSRLLRGSGRGPSGGTRINLANGVNDYIFKFPSIVEPGMRGFEISGMSLYCNGLNQTAGGGVDALSAIECKFPDLHVNQPYDHGVRLGGKSDGFGHNNWVPDLWADGSADSGGVAGLGQAVHVVGSDENRITGGNWQSMGGRSVAVTGVGSWAAQDWVGLNTWDGITVVGGLVTATVFAGGLFIRDCNRVKVLNWVFDGVPGDNLFATGDSHIVTGNHVMGPGNATSPRSGLVFDNNTAMCQVANNVLESSQTNGWTRSLIRETGVGSAPDNDYGPNTYRVHPGVTLTGAKIELAGGSLSRIVNSRGMRTYNKGTTAFGAAVTSVTAISHGLDFTPAAGDFTLDFAADPLAAGHAWVSAITSTTFTLNVKTAPGGAGTTVAWKAGIRS